MAARLLSVVRISGICGQNQSLLRSTSVIQSSQRLLSATAVLNGKPGPAGAIRAKLDHYLSNPQEIAEGSSPQPGNNVRCRLCWCICSYDAATGTYTEGKAEPPICRHAAQGAHARGSCRRLSIASGQYSSRASYIVL